MYTSSAPYKMFYWIVYVTNEMIILYLPISQLVVQMFSL